MTGAYLMTTRNGERVPVEIENLTDEERRQKFKQMSPDEIVGWLNFLCRFLRNVEQPAVTKEQEEMLQNQRPICNAATLAVAKCVDLYNEITPEGIEDLPPSLQPTIRAMCEIGARPKNHCPT